MADKNVSIDDIKQMANGVDASNSESVNNFLSSVDEKFKDVPAADRAAKLNMLSAELENRGVLPQLLVTAGLGDYKSEKYQQMKESGDDAIKKDDLENMSKNGKKGFFNVDAAAQFLASSLLRNIDGNSGISQEYSSYNFGIPDGKIDFKQIRRWAARENSEQDTRRGLEKAMLQWDSLASKMETEKPKLDDVQALLKADKHTKEKLLTPEEREAAKFLLDNFDKIRSIDNSSFRPYSYDNWISKGKLDYWGKNELHTSSEDAAARKKSREDLAAQQAAEKQKELQRAAESKAVPAENDRIKQLEAQLKQQEERLKKQQETIDRLLNTKPGETAPNPKPPETKPAEQPKTGADTKPPAKPPETKPAEQPKTGADTKPPAKPPETKPAEQPKTGADTKPPAKPPETKPAEQPKTGADTKPPAETKPPESKPPEANKPTDAKPPVVAPKPRDPIADEQKEIERIRQLLKQWEQKPPATSADKVTPPPENKPAPPSSDKPVTPAENNKAPKQEKATPQPPKPTFKR